MEIDLVTRRQKDAKARFLLISVLLIYVVSTLSIIERDGDL